MSKTIQWKMSYIIGISLILQGKWDNGFIQRWIDKNSKNVFISLIDVIIAIIWIAYMLVILLLLQFIESPIRKIIFKGSVKDKFKQWLYVWKSTYDGALKGWRHEHTKPKR